MTNLLAPKGKLVKKCRITECPYHDNNAKIEVPYSGNLKADLFLIGESPGRSEERAVVAPAKRGGPFLGKSGDVLNALLSSVGLKRGDVFIANACRCRIDKDGDPTKDVNKALACCLTHVQQALIHVKPSLIIAFGAYSLRQLTGRQKITENRGKLFWATHDTAFRGGSKTEWTKRKKAGEIIKFKYPLFSTFHPAYVLRGCSRDFPDIPLGSMNLRERILFEDFAHAIRWADSNVKPKDGPLQAKINTKGYTLGTTADVKALSQAEVLSLDFETTGLDMHDTGIRPLSVSFSLEKGKSLVYLAGRPVWDKKLGAPPAYAKRLKPGEFPKGIMKLFTNPTTKKIVASRSFEDDVCFQKLGVRLEEPVHDVQIMAHVLDENARQYNLEFLADALIEIKGIKMLAQGKRDQLELLLLKDLVAYNGVDTDATLRVYLKLRKKLENEPILAKYYVYHVLEVARMLARTQMNGSRIDTKALKKAEDMFNKRLVQLSKKAITLIHPSILEEHADKGYKLTRRDLIADVLFRHAKGFRLKPDEKFITAKTKQPSTKEDHLKLFPRNKFAQICMEYAKLSKLQSTYVTGLWPKIKPDGKIYPQMHMNRTVTGRTSSSKPNIQNVPQRSEMAKYVKKCYAAPPGWILGARDLAQSEMRIAGWLADDPNILGALAAGIDLHTKTAALVNQISIEDVDSLMRFRAKAVNFGFLFGMGPEGFQAYALSDYGLKFSLPQCRKFRENFFSYPDGYYKLKTYYRETREFLLKHGYVESPIGRRRRLPEVYGSKKDMASAFRMAINHRIQSFSSDLALIAMFLFQRKVETDKKLIGKVQVLWFIHDAIMYLVKPRTLTYAMKTLRHCMNVEAPAYVKKYYGVTLGYPVESDGKHGANWADLTKWEEVA